MANVIHYERPTNWIAYDGPQLMYQLSEAKAAVLSLRTVPYQKRWVESLQRIELKREVAGTSRIEGAEFTDRELDDAMQPAPAETAAQLFTRSQNQAAAAVKTYLWIARLAPDHPINGDLVKEIHRRIVTGADDDRCDPGTLRSEDQNVSFGAPRHRGVSGGEQCVEAFDEFVSAIREEFPKHDPLLQAIAAHYHLAAMHPFLDGNGRTARALEALILQRSGLRDTTFLFLSNYYYDQKEEYLDTLARVRRERHNLTSFMIFSLKGIYLQSQRMLKAIQDEISKELYWSLATELFSHLRTPKKRVIAGRQLELIRILLSEQRMEWPKLVDRSIGHYRKMSDPMRALVRDVNSLSALDAITVTKENEQYVIAIRLEWPSRMTEQEFFNKLKELPKAKTSLILLH